MDKPVKRRHSYASEKRANQAAATRRAILAAGRELFLRQGYARTTVEQIASQAGVAVDTIYATVGRKPALLRELIETAISGRDEAVPARERHYVRAIEAAPDARSRIEIYAAAIAEIQPRIAPLFIVLREAAVTDRACADLWSQISERRAQNMRDFAASLRGTGEMRPDLSNEQAADVVWSMNAAEYWDLLVTQRGWTPAAFRGWLVDAWTRLLLRT